LVRPLAYRRDRCTDFDAQYIIGHGSAQGSAFWGLKNSTLIFNLFIRKLPKNYNGAYGENLQKFSNSHNFRCIQDRVVIFVSTDGFRGRPIQRHHLNLPPTDPCCHGNEI